MLMFFFFRENDDKKWSDVNFFQAGSPSQQSWASAKWPEKQGWRHWVPWSFQWNFQPPGSDGAARSAMAVLSGHTGNTIGWDSNLYIKPGTVRASPETSGFAVSVPNIAKLDLSWPWPWRFVLLRLSCILVYTNHIYCCVHARHEHDSKARLKNINLPNWLVVSYP